MNWRPKNWDKIKEDAITRIGGSWNQDTHRQLFQAGADAMLEAIREEIEKVVKEVVPDKLTAREASIIWKILALLKK